MKNVNILRLFPGMLICLFYSSLVFATGSELKFTATVHSIDPSDVDSGVVTISVQEIEVPIQVNGDTEIEGDGIVLALSDLNIGDRVKVDAYFAEPGIVANEITVIIPRDPSFDFKGELSAVTPEDMLPEGIEFSGTPTSTSSVGYTSITILGTDVFLSEETNIYSGNPPWEPMDSSELSAGDFTVVTGGFDGVLWAERILVGYREVGEIELDGTIITLDDRQFVVDIEGGGTTTVVINEDTRISGELAIGLMVEIEGMLNSELAVVATEIVVDTDGDGEADDDNRRARPTLPPQAQGRGLGLDPFHTGMETALRSDSRSTEAIVKIRDMQTPGTSRMSFNLKLMNAPSDTAFTVIASFGVTDVEFGSVLTDEDGMAELDYDSRPNRPDHTLNSMIPDGFSLRDITSVQIMMGDSVILEKEI